SSAMLKCDTGSSANWARVLPIAGMMSSCRRPGWARPKSPVGRAQAATARSRTSAAARRMASDTLALRTRAGHRLCRYWLAVTLVAHPGEEEDLRSTTDRWPRFEMAPSFVELDQLSQACLQQSPPCTSAGRQRGDAYPAKLIKRSSRLTVR